MATLDQAFDQMLGAGMPPFPDGRPRIAGKIIRYGPKSRAWYVLHDYLAHNGKRYVHGAFGIWGQLDSTKIETDYAGMDMQEQERLRASLAELEARERAKRAERARFAANRANQQWDSARAALPAAGCPYLAKKGVIAERGLRFFKDGTMLVPMVRYDVTEEMEHDPAPDAPRRLVGVQKIGPDGAKRFNKGMAKAGAACRLGKAPKDGDPILVCEGVATGLSIRQGISQSHAVFVAFDAGNLPLAAKIVRALYPASPLILCADDDAYLEAQMNRHLRDDYGAPELLGVSDKEQYFRTLAGETIVRGGIHAGPFMVPMLMGAVEIAGSARTFVFRNAGRLAAHEAAREVGNARVIYPDFAGRELCLDPEAPRLTDFNDLHATQGLAVLSEQLRATLAKPPEGEAAAPEAKAGGAAGGSGTDGPDWQVYWSMMGRFTQVYPSDEAFDGQIGRLVKIPHMRLMFGNRAVNLWLAAERKRVVMTEDVVFDPTGTANPKTTVNLFRGIAMKPKAGECRKLLELLYYLCGETLEDTHAPCATWLLRWAAYPLQHLGAKMQTAVVMYGPEGTGKNLFWGAVRAIYAGHGGVISQMQLQSQFNDWLSAKLFLIANEVVTRMELKHYVGILKNLVTEPEVWINPKHIGARSEANHCNLVFLSNELHPMWLGPRDRRYMVVRTPNERPEAFYREVSDEVRAGGFEAFYAYLLELELGDFNEHTKPVMTESKESLIELGYASGQIFWQELHDNLLGLPYCPALVQDVYRAYCAWCVRNGHKMPQALHMFSPNFMSLNGVKRCVERVPDPDSTRELALANPDEVRQRKVFLMGEPEADPKLEKLRMLQGVASFRRALKVYLEEDRVYARDPDWMRGEAA